MADEPRSAATGAVMPAPDPALDGVASEGQRWADLAVAVVVVGQFVIRTTLAARGNWFGDDWGFLSSAATRTFALNDLFVVYGGQLHPVLWELFQFQDWAFPGSYTSAAVMIGALQAVSVLLVYLVLRRLFGARLPVVAVVAWFAFTPLTLESRLWATVAFYTLPFQIAFAATLLLFLRHLDDPSRRSAALVVVGQVAALLCWQKAVYIPVVLFVVAAWSPVLAERAIGWRAALSRFRALWVALALLNGAYLAGYLWLSAENATIYGLAGLPDLPEVIESGWLITRNFVVSLVGGPWRWDRPTLSLADPPLLLSVLSVVALGALLVWCWRTRRAALALWSLVGALLAVDFALIAFGRLENLPSVSEAGYLRYVADLAIPTVLAIAFTFLRPRSAPPPPPPADTRSRHGVLKVALLSLAVVSAAASSATLLREWGRNPATAYVDNLRSALAERPAPPLLLVQETPPEVIAPFYSPYNTTQVVVAVIRQEATFVDYVSQEGPLLGVLPSGDIAPVEIGPTPFTLTYRSPTGPELCGWALSPTPVDIPLQTLGPDPTISVGRWYGQIRLTSDAPATILSVAGQTWLRAEVPAGSSDLYFSMFGPATGIRLWVEDPAAEICVRSVLVGQLVGRSP